MKTKLGLVIASLCALLLIACGGGSRTAITADNFIDLVSAAQLEAKTVRTEMFSTDGGERSPIMAGVLEFGPELSDRAMDVSMGDAASGTEVRIMLVDGVGYVNMFDLFDGKFRTYDPSSDANFMGIEIQYFHQIGDPAVRLEQFQGALTSVKKVGDGGTIDGVSTTEFVLFVDSSKLPEAAAFEGVSQMLEFHLWIGEDHLPRKLTSDNDNVVNEIWWTEWGKAVTVTAPEADELADMESDSPYEPSPGGPRVHVIEPDTSA